MIYALCLLGGFITGGILAWFIASDRTTRNMVKKVQEANEKANAAGFQSSNMQGSIEELRKQITKAAGDFDTLRSKMEAEQAAKTKAETQLAETLLRLEEEKKTLDQAKTKLTETFKALAGDTLNESTTAFLRLAKETLDKTLVDAKGDLSTRQEAIQGIVKPLSDSLIQFNEHIASIEKSRQEGYASLTEQLKGVAETQQQLRTETSNLVTALRRPEVRGRWGELTLRRVVELSGMSPHCDFCEQVSVETEQGRQRPDLIINMPAERQIVVDSKAPLDAYLDATKAASEEERKTAMVRHAGQVRVHMDTLSSKGYWEQFDKAPEFVVMFIAGESFFSAALEADGTLMEDALQKRVVIATPATLIALLRAVAYGWRQEEITQNIEAISSLGKELFERISNLADHFNDMGKNIARAVESYNKGIGSLESRVLVSARKFKEMGITSGKEIPDAETIQVIPRMIVTEAESKQKSGVSDQE